MGRPLSFKKAHTLAERTEMANQLRIKYPSKVLVIVEPRGTDLPPPQRIKYLAEETMSVGQLLSTIRNCSIPRQENGNSDKSIYILISTGQHQGIVPNPTLLMVELYQKYKQEDGFVYVEYMLESVFG